MQTKDRGSNSRPRKDVKLLATGVRWLAIMLIILGFAFSKSPMTVLASSTSLIIVVLLLWRNDFPPILLLPVLFQWSEVAIMPISTIWNGLSIDEISNFNANMEPAAYLGLAGIVSLAFGMYFGCKLKYRSYFNRKLKESVRRWGVRKVRRLSIFAIIFGYTLSTIVSIVPPSLHQPVLAAASIKYLGLFALTYSSLLSRSNYKLLALIVLGDIIFGMTGFFAEFKFTVLTVFVAAISARSNFRREDIFVFFGTSIAVLIVAIFWSAMKADYRTFVNHGTGYQVVDVSMGQRLSYIGGFASAMDLSTVSDGFERLVRRHGYIEFLALTMENVPNRQAHEYGNMTWQAIKHVTMPRILFPNKPSLPSDTAVMLEYTGLPPLWDLSKVSISLGNLTEMYIDFGVFGALVIEFILGFGVGRLVYELSSYKKLSPLLNAGFCVMIVLPICYFGTSLPKLVGSFIYISAIVFFLQRYFLLRLFKKLNIAAI